MEYAQVYNGKIRKARKDHVCCSGFPIKKGTDYFYASGIDCDGEPFSEKINLYVKEIIDNLNKGKHFDDQSHYSEFWEIEWSYKELAKFRFYLQDNGIDSSKVLWWSLTRRMDVLWERMQADKEIQRLEANDQFKEAYLNKVCLDLDCRPNVIQHGSFEEKIDLIVEKLVTEKEDLIKLICQQDI